jgi:hypothetical protein
MQPYTFPTIRQRADVWLDRFESVAAIAGIIAVYAIVIARLVRA